MQDEARKLLEDMREAAEQIAILASGKTLEQYEANKPLRWSVERGFEIIGEAMTQLNKMDATLAAQITDYRKIISFRNILIHGYSRVNHQITWDIVQQDLAVLQKDVEQLLANS